MYRVDEIRVGRVKRDSDEDGYVERGRIMYNNSECKPPHKVTIFKKTFSSARL